MLVEGTEPFERWVNVPQPLEFKVYIFNVTNSRDIENGALPIVEEIGPYVYKYFNFLFNLLLFSFLFLFFWFISVNTA